MRHFKKDRPKWQQKLTVREIRHLEEMGMSTLAGAIRNAEFQAELRADRMIKFPESPGIAEPCFDCKTISRKLGLPV
jgi:hypothetical protein